MFRSHLALATEATATSPTAPPRLRHDAAAHRRLRRPDRIHGTSGVSSPAELLRLVTWFEATAHDLITSHGGRLVKLIGDEVMFTTVEPGRGVHDRARAHPGGRRTGEAASRTAR
ncbi:MAG: hypothetical protein R2713_02725 [Ilumatobacteraceae bacterium]